MLNFNEQKLRDKIHACWVGKNIGGTMGAPYETSQQINDIQGFVTPEGSVLPNDDLDMQLVWLRAMDELGPENVDSKTLGEYWLSFIGPSWNEYGVCKSNMHNGIVPPMSGELYNDEWKNSNGAWIRTEIWACTHPGAPDKAIEYAFMDASVDHGFGEGSYAAMFVAALQSAAFVIDDINTLLDIALSKIPVNCRVARSVNIVRDCFAQGISWKDARQRLVDDSADLGWFQAPANVAFVVLGLLYGGCDFKKSMILAINCGDDTDCTGATLGATLGIIYGSKGIPADWSAHIGDSIETITIIKGHGYFPRSCTELTECVMNLLPVTMRTGNEKLVSSGPEFKISDGDDDFGGIKPQDFMGRDFADATFKRSVYSFTMKNTFIEALVEFDREPVITPLGTVGVRVSAKQRRNMADQKHLRLRWLLPEGWNAAGRRDIHVSALWSPQTKYAFSDTVITAGENVEAANSIILELTCVGRPTPLLIPITLLG